MSPREASPAIVEVMQSLAEERAANTVSAGSAQLEIAATVGLGRERVSALRALAYLAGGQLSLVALLALSVLLLPQGVAHQEALSYYGAQTTTVAPYTLAFLSAALGTQRALRLLPTRSRPLRRLRGALRAILILLLAVLATPYTGESALDWLHLTFAATLFTSATVLALWLAARVLCDWPTRALTALQVATGLLVLLSESNSVHLLAASELLFVFAFGLLLIRSLAQLLASAPDPSRDRRYTTSTPPT